jgi:uncharacterized protein YaeQ
MAEKATVFKADLQIADMDRHYYRTHALTLARHPSETDERMMARLLAFALYASEALVFGKGISSGDEPALWQKDLTGVIERWIEVGQPDEREIRKACGRARHVVIISYGRPADLWWNQNRDKLQRLDNLTVLRLPPASTQALAAFASRNMHLQCTIQEGLVWITNEAGAVQIEPQALLRAAGDKSVNG